MCMRVLLMCNALESGSMLIKEMKIGTGTMNAMSVNSICVCALI